MTTGETQENVCGRSYVVEDFTVRFTISEIDWSVGSPLFELEINGRYDQRRVAGVKGGPTCVTICMRK